jgi:DNA invertase Pin-like site-specific DNA recombinase
MARKPYSSPESAPVRAAEYVRMSTEHQKYSIANQQALIQTYAAANNMKVIRTYMDEGRSGVTLKGRLGLTSLLADVVSGTAPFEAILVYDVSRWGRFQDADESAHYEFLCRRAGIKMVYCAEQFPLDPTPLASVLKSLKRAMAGEFSRELGVKVAAGKARIGKLGFRIGGPPGYGLRRQILTDGREPGLMLNPGQKKSIQTDRVTLVPGPSEELAMIRRIYTHYIYLRQSEREIAEAFNQEGLTHFGKPWSRALVRTVLSNEKYIGHNVVGRVTARLYTRQVPVPEEKWMRCEDAFQPIVPKPLFEAAALVRRFNEKVYVSRDEILRGLKRLLRREGRLSAALINRAPELPSAHTVGLRFGTLTQAYEVMGYTPDPRYRYHALERALAPHCTSLTQELLALLQSSGVPAWAAGERVIAFGGCSSVEIQISRWHRIHNREGGWRISYQRHPGAEFLVAVRLNTGSESVKDYLLVPRADLRRLPDFIRVSHAAVIAPYAYPTPKAVVKKLMDGVRRQRESGKGKLKAGLVVRAPGQQLCPRSSRTPGARK